MINKEELDRLKSAVESKLQEEVLCLSYLDKGACNNIFYCETESSKYSIKQERADKLDTDKNTLALEADVFKLLENNRIPHTPHLVFFDEVEKIACYSYLTGIALDSTISTLSEGKKAKIFTNLGKWHAQVHDIVSPLQAKQLGITLDRRSLSEEILELKNTVTETSVVDNKLNEIISIAENYISQITDYKIEVRFSHGDLHGGNILINDGAISGIVDFGDSAIGDIHRDFAPYARHYPEYLEIIIDSYNESSSIKLDKQKIVLHGLLLDINKVIYHLRKLNSGGSRLLKKLELYDQILSRI